MGKPFKVGAQPARTNPGSSGQVQREGKNPARTAGKAVDDETTLVEAGQAGMAPDGDVADEGEAGEGDGARPTFHPSNPWPEAKPVARKPFKL